MKSQQRNEQRCVIMVGPFPPPVGGMAIGNEFVRERLETMGVKLSAINLAPPTLDRRLLHRLRRLPRVIQGLGRLLITPRLKGATLYVRVSGGLGQAYDICFLIVARFRGMRRFVSHHSFAYLDQRSFVTQGLVMASGKSTTHVTLSENMAVRLKDLYPQAIRVLSISNSALFKDVPDLPRRNPSSLRTLGFLSIVSEEKGVFRFLDVAAESERRGLTVAAKLAGPFQDNETEYRVRNRLRQLKSVEYVGAKYGDDKRAFFNSIDVLLFPTTFADEAEPRTIHEALMSGIPVIANRRGCIGDVLKEGAGLVVDRPEDFVGKAVEQLEAWLASPDTLRQASRAARARYLALRNESAGRLESLLGEICSANPVNPGSSKTVE